jgi:beta-galactosidase
MKTEYQDGLLFVYNRLDFTNLEEYEFVYWIESDGQRITECKQRISVKPHESTVIPVSYEPVICKYGTYLHTALYRDGKEFARTQHPLPCELVKEERSELAELKEDALHIYASGEHFSYIFSKHYGVFTSMKIDGQEQLDGRTVLSAFRAPTDNERNIKVRWANINIWQGENLDCAFTKIYECGIENQVIVLKGS